MNPNTSKLGNLDDVFFAEWNGRKAGARRSLRRAADLLNVLAPSRTAPLLTIVGSKGKGTTAIYASAYLAAAGHRTVTVTSPSLLSPTERLRVDGVAVSPRRLVALGQRLADGLATLPSTDTTTTAATGTTTAAAGGGYASPSGLFTIAGLLLASETAADFAVIEAGRGGLSDEVSLVDATVVAVSPIFAEHLDELGGSIASVVKDKCGVVTDTTASVVTGVQTPSTMDLIRAAVRDRTRGRLDVECVARSGSGLRVPASLLPAGLGRDNALLGCLAAHRLLELVGQAPPDADRLSAVLGSIQLPGRLSHHRIGATEVLVDAAVSAAGYAAALDHAVRRWGAVDHVLLSLPDDKDLDGAVAALADLPVSFVTLDLPHLRYTRDTPATWRRLPGNQLDRTYVGGLGGRVLAMGTISFVGHLLRLARATTGIAFRPAAHGRGSAAAHPTAAATHTSTSSRTVE